MKTYFIMKILIVFGIVFSLLTPAFADNIGISFTNSTMNFGTVVADGSTTSISSTIKLSGNTNVDLYVRTSSDFTDVAGDTIPNDPNFLIRIQYAPDKIDSDYLVLNSIDQKLWGNWPKPNPGGGDIATETYNLIVPPVTPEGTYNTTVIFTVVTAGTIPNSASPVQMNNVITSSSNDTTNVSFDNTTSTTENDSNLIYTLLTLLKQYL